MNDLIQTKINEVIKTDEEFYQHYENLKTEIEWFDTIKYKFKEIVEPYVAEGCNFSWKNDVFGLQLIKPFQKKTKEIDKDRMKATNIMIVNAESGELEEVNAYDYFATKEKNPTKPYVKEIKGNG